MKNTLKTKIITGPKTRFSYLNVLEPKSIFPGDTPKFSVSLVIPKSDAMTIAKINAAIEAAFIEGESKLKGNGHSIPALSDIKTPLRDGDVERSNDPTYANSYFINATSTVAPGIVDAHCNPILNKNEIYSGIYGRASIYFFAYSVNGVRGIAARLLNLQKLEDGNPLCIKSSAEDDFSNDDDEFLS